MSVHVIDDPASDPRWAELLNRHPAASVFHSPGWLTALNATYGYEPFVVTTSSSTTLHSGLALCRIKGWRSHRLVSLPFSDHCDPLLWHQNELLDVLAFLAREVDGAGCRSVELRPRRPLTEAADAHHVFVQGRGYCLHTVDLCRSTEQIFKDFHQSSTQRAVRRAEREGVTYESGTSQSLLESFYRLLRMSRRRHGLPPQPLAWFRNLVACLGDGVRIHVATKNGQSIAALLTLSFKKTLIYKYGGSDAQHHRVGAMPFLFWRVIQDAKAQGYEELDLGRSDLDQPGLIAFKDHLGGRRSTFSCYSYPEARNSSTRDGAMSRIVRRIVAHLPDTTLDLAGRLVYPHLG